MGESGKTDRDLFSVAQKRKPIPPYHPMAAGLLAAMVGILSDAAFHPGSFFWTVLFTVFATGFFCSRFLAKRRLKSKNSGGRFFDFDSETFASLVTFVLIAAVFALNHDRRWNLFPNDEIGFFLPPAGSPATLEATVDESPVFIPAPNDSPDRIFRPVDRTFFRIRAERLADKDGWRKVSGRIQTMVAGDCRDLEIGDRIRVTGLAWRPPGMKNPGDPDQAFFLRSNRVLWEMTVNYPEAVVRLGEGKRFSVRRLFGRWRNQADRIFQKNLSRDNATLASAIILGIRSGLDEDIQSDFRETGTGHLLAISGLHVVIVTGILYVFLRLFFLSPRTEAVLLAIGAVFYLLMTDRSPSAIRATIFVLVACGGLFFHRRPFSVNSLALAGLIILAINPSDLFQTGPHLSFLATGVFLWFGKGEIRSEETRRRPATEVSSEAEESNDAGHPFRRVVRRLRKTRDHLRERKRNFLYSLRWSHPFLNLFSRLLFRLLKRMGQIMVASLVIWLVLLPIVLRRFSIATPMTILINPLVWIPMTFSLVSGVLLLGSSVLLPFATPVFGFLADSSFGFFRGFLQTAHSAGGFYRLGGPSLWWTIGFYLPLVFWTLFPGYRPSRRRLFLWAILWIAVGAGAGFWRRWENYRDDRVIVEILSVGHGGAILTFFPDGRTVLYDCGSFSSARGASRRVTRALFREGRTSLDLVILSHADADHYNGLFDLSETVPIRRLSVSPVFFAKKTSGVQTLEKWAKDRTLPIWLAKKGTSFAEIGFPELTAFHPPADSDEKWADGESNASSLVVGLTHRGRRILLPGDLDAKSAPFLMEPPIHFDLILSPHHGGKSDNYRNLLDWATPRVIVISGGLFTRNPESEESLREEGFLVLNTFDHGRIRIEITRPIKGKDEIGVMVLTP